MHPGASRFGRFTRVIYCYVFPCCLDAVLWLVMSTLNPIQPAPIIPGVTVVTDRGNGITAVTTHTRVLADGRFVGYTDTGVLHGPELRAPFEPNEAQRETIRRDYSSPAVSWVVKPGEYSDEAAPDGGYAGIATLANGWVVTVGRYGAVLSERRPEQPRRVRSEDMPGPFTAPYRGPCYGTTHAGTPTSATDRRLLAMSCRSGSVSGDTGRAHGPELPEQLPAPLAGRLETTFRGTDVAVIGFDRSSMEHRAAMVRYVHAAAGRTDHACYFLAPLRAVHFPTSV